MPSCSWTPLFGKRLAIRITIGDVTEQKVKGVGSERAEVEMQAGKEKGKTFP